MKKIIYSKASFEDLLSLKSYLIESQEALTTMIVLSKLVDDINNLDQNYYKGSSLKNFMDIDIDYKFIKSQGQVIFFRIEDETILIDRILSEELEYVKELGIIGSDLYVDS